VADLRLRRPAVRPGAGCRYSRPLSGCSSSAFPVPVRVGQAEDRRRRGADVRRGGGKRA